jgi:hypothetical protein
VGLERGPLSLMSTVEELLGRKGSSSGLENRDYGRRRSATLTTRHPSIRKSLHKVRLQAGRSIGIVRSRTLATQFVCFVMIKIVCTSRKVFWVVSKYNALT